MVRHDLPASRAGVHGCSLKAWPGVQEGGGLGKPPLGRKPSFASTSTSCGPVRPRCRPVVAVVTRGGQQGPVRTAGGSRTRDVKGTERVSVSGPSPGPGESASTRPLASSPGGAELGSPQSPPCTFPCGHSVAGHQPPGATMTKSHRHSSLSLSRLEAGSLFTGPKSRRQQDGACPRPFQPQCCPSPWPVASTSGLCPWGHAA